MKKTNITKSRIMKPVATGLLFFLLFIANVSYAQNYRGVLVVAETSEVQRSSLLEIRRIYLGLPSTADGLINKPVINISNIEVYREFLKNVMHMTEKGYRRKVIKRIFRQGGEKVKEIKNVTELVAYLNRNLYDVSFMDEDTAKNIKGIKVVQVLW